VPGRADPRGCAAGDSGAGQSFELRTPLPAGRVLILIVTGEPPVLTLEQVLQVARLAVDRIR
jgi:hypothetical protein